MKNAARGPCGASVLLTLTVLLLPMSVPPSVRAAGKSKPADILDILALPADESEEAVLAFCRAAGEGQREAMCSLAEQEEHVGPVYGEVAVALARVADESTIPWGVRMTKHANPVQRYLGVVAVRAPGGAASRDALLELLASQDAGVRSLAALSLRRFAGPQVKQALAKVAESGEAACERSCAASALGWMAAAPDALSRPARKTVVLDGKRDASAAFLDGVDVMHVAGDSKALADPQQRAAVLERLRAGATLHVVYPGAKPPAGLDEALQAVDLAAPRAAAIDGMAAFAWNWSEGHAVQDAAHDAYRGRVRAEQGSALAGKAEARVASWLPQTKTAFRAWDSRVWAAPLRGVSQPDLACLLEAPPAKGRGRVVLDLCGGNLKAWEHNNNLKAFLEGPQALRLLSFRGSFSQPVEAPYFDVQEDVVTPHVPWAKPLAGGAIKAAFLVPENSIRTAIEIGQRIELARRYLPFNGWSFGRRGDPKKRDLPVIDGASALRLRMFLEQPADVLVIPGEERGQAEDDIRHSWNALFPDLRAEILQAVRRGTGLVALGEFPASGDAEFAGTSVPVPPEILRTMPIPEAKARELVACYRYGKGRIVHFRMHAILGRALLDLGPDFIVPGLEVPHARIVSDEYAFAAVAAGVLWASGRQMGDASAKEDVHLRDRFAARLPADAPLTGPAVSESRRLDADGKVIGWSAKRVGPAAAAVVDIELADRLVRPGAVVQARVSLGDHKGDELLCEVIDRHGRVPRRFTVPAVSPKTDLTVQPWKPLGRIHDLHVVLRQDGKPVAEQMLPFAVDVFPDPLSLQLWAWGGPLYMAPGFHRVGMTGLSAGELNAYGEPAQGQPEAATNEAALRAGFDILLVNAVRGSAVGNSGSNGDVCNPGMSDPALWQAVRRNVAELGPSWRLCGINRGVLRDEWGVGAGFCYGPNTMTHFRRELQARYKSLDELNAAWGRRYKTWTEVFPDRLPEAAKRGNLVSWAEHRAFMDDEVARLAGVPQRMWREYVPDAALGYSSYVGATPDGGFDMEKLMQQSTFLVRRAWEMRDARDLGRPDTVFSNWLNAGYDTTLRSSHLAKLEVSYDLLEKASSIYYWYGFGGFAYPMIRPDLTVVEMLRPMADELASLRQGLDRLVLGAKLDHSGYGVLFNQASLRTLHGLNAIAGGECQVKWDWDAAQRLLDPIQVRGRLFSSDDLCAGRIGRDGAKMLFLPGTVSLTEPQMAALERFVADGGRLVADVLPGRYSEFGAARDQSRMAKLFGVTGQFEPRTDVAAAGIEVAGSFAKLQPLLGKARPSATGLKVAGGTALGSIGKEPAFVENKTGEGMTLLLNFSLPESLAASPVAKAKWTTAAAAAAEVGMPGYLSSDEPRHTAALLLADWGGVRPAAQVYGDPERKELFDPPLDVYQYRDGENLIVGVLNRDTRQRAAVVVLPEAAAMYDTRSDGRGGRSEVRKELAITVPPAAAAVCVCTPRPLPPLDIKADYPKGGDIRVAIGAGGGRRIVRVEATDPGGRQRPELSGNLDFRGQGAFVVPLAANDPPGTWKIRARDVVTGATHDLEVTP